MASLSLSHLSRNKLATRLYEEYVVARCGRHRVMPQNALLSRLNAFTNLDADDRTRLDALCRDVRTIAPKRDITSEGDRPQHVHLVIDGWAARYKMVNGGSRQITAFLLPGDF